VIEHDDRRGHEYGEPFFDEDCGVDGAWLRVCETCGHVIAVMPPKWARGRWRDVPWDYGDPRSNR
jgi:hypothetical protein